jgi:5S rRNA maturation endonuclease (ribonuclease M5)
VIYRLPEILRYADATIFVCEGEKDADRAASLGHCATTVAGGKWTEDCVKAFAYRDVMILEDADEAGRKKALLAATALHGTAIDVPIIRPHRTPQQGRERLVGCGPGAESLSTFVSAYRSGRRTP